MKTSSKIKKMRNQEEDFTSYNKQSNNKKIRKARKNKENFNNLYL